MYATVTFTGLQINRIELKSNKCTHTLRANCYLANELKPSSGKKKAFSTNGAESTGSQHVEGYKFIHSIYLKKAEVHVDQQPPHQTRDNEFNRKESVEEPGANGHRGKFPEHNINSLCFKIKN